jgi:hypothetical protein
MNVGYSGTNISRVRMGLSRVFAIVFAAAVIWAVAATLKGRIVIDLHFVRLSSRGPRQAIIIAALCGITAWIATPGRRGQVLVADWRRIGRPVFVAALVLVVIAVALVQGARVAGGSDSYGYVSQAHLWTTGTPHGEPLIEDLAPLVPPEALAPLGYRLAPDRTSIVPVYSPGFPMVMAVFERLGGRDAVFYVVPLLGGLAVWATYLMGARLAGRTVGVSAAVLLATSPPFLFQLMVPMSDVPVTAWWTLSMALLPLKRRDAAFAAGIVAGIALLTRPNLVPVLIAPGALLAWHLASERSAHSVQRLAAQRLGLFMAGVLPACIGIAILNTWWYGSPLKSGYGSLEYLYSWNNLWPNVERYSRWLLDAQTPAVFLGVLGPIFLWRFDSGTPERRAMTITLVMFIALVLLCYLFYSPFDAWWYLRFLLPAFPPLLVLMSVSLVSSVTRVAGRLRDVVIVAIIGLLAWHGVNFARDHFAFASKEGERKYVAVGNYIAQRLPDRAVIICMQFSGSVRYYSGRPTIRYDSVPEAGLDSLVAELTHIGYEPYILVEDSEKDKFVARFKERGRFGALDWPPVARFRPHADVEIYDPVHIPLTGTASEGFTETIN